MLNLSELKKDLQMTAGIWYICITHKHVCLYIEKNLAKNGQVDNNYHILHTNNRLPDAKKTVVFSW